MPKSLKDNICEKALFEKLYRRHSKNLHDFLYYKFGAEYNPQDKVQESFIKLWENCRKVPLAKARNFLFTVANNMMLNESKHKKVVLKYQKDKQSPENNQDPQFLLEEKEYLHKFQKALSQLTESQRTAFLLNRTEGKKHQEIAEIMNISRKTVEKHLYAALKKLRKTIKEM